MLIACVVALFSGGREREVSGGVEGRACIDLLEFSMSASKIWRTKYWLADYYKWERTVDKPGRLPWG